MRIMYCLPEMSNPGGIGRVTAIKANSLVRNGHKVCIITTDQHEKKSYYFLEDSVQCIDLNVDFESYQRKNLFIKLYKRFTKTNLYEKRLFHIVEQWNPDIIVSTFNNEAFFLYRWNDGSKKILENHFCHDRYKRIAEYGQVSICQRLLNCIKVQIQEKVVCKYDAFVVLTNEDMEKWGHLNNMYVIPNIVSFSPKEVSTCCKKRAIAVGRLDFQKKFDRLINIWNKVHLKFPDWRLDIYGQGPDQQELQHIIEKLTLSNVIQIHPPTMTIMDEYINSSLLLMTSTYEGLPMTLLEAFACGIPCVAYSFPCGPMDLITNNIDGFCVKEGDEEEFVNRVTEILYDTDKRRCMGQAAHEKSKKYSVNNVMPQWMNLFSNVLNR